MENRPSIWGEGPPKFITKPSRTFARVGQSGKFSAKITGRPQPQVTWLKVRLNSTKLSLSQRHLSCSLSSFLPLIPYTSLSFHQGDVEIQSSGRYSMVERSGVHFLEIREVCVEDAGTYTCSVTNSAGTASATAELNVQGEPQVLRLPSRVLTRVYSLHENLPTFEICIYLFRFEQ